MTQKIPLALVAATYLVFAPVASGKEKSVEPDLTAGKATEKEKKVCKVFADTGSRLSKTKICKTASEWQEDRLENADVVNKRRGAQGGPTPDG